MTWLNEATELKTAEDKQAEAKKRQKQLFVSSVQAHLDSVAQERDYDNILSLCTYATDPDPKFSAEGQAAVEWRGKVWAYCYKALEDIESGLRGIPTQEELISELPTFTWPVGV